MTRIIESMIRLYLALAIVLFGIKFLINLYDRS